MLLTKVFHFFRARWITPKTQRLARFCLLISCRCWILAQIWMMILTKYSNYLKKNVIAPCYIICVFINKIQHYVEFYIIGRNLNLKNGFKKLPRGKINLCFHSALVKISLDHLLSVYESSLSTLQNCLTM